MVATVAAVWVAGVAVLWAVVLPWLGLALAVLTVVSIPLALAFGKVIRFGSVDHSEHCPDAPPSDWDWPERRAA